MTERSRFWGGTVTGDASAAPYDAETEFAQVLRSISGAGGITPDLSCVFPDLNKLAPSGIVSPVAIATGRALVDGTWYENDASFNVVIPTPGALTRIDRIVLRKSFAAETVRITRIAGTEGGAAPAITQTAGTTWDEPICQASITTGGVITIIDERRFVAGSYPPLFARKIADEIVNNSNTLQNDDHLFLALEALLIYEFEAVLSTSTVSTTPDIKVAFTVPAGAAIRWGGVGAQPVFLTSTPNGGSAGVSGTAVVFSLATANEYVHIRGLVIMGVTAGTLQLQWAQNAATVEDTKLLTNSYIIARRVG